MEKNISQKSGTEDYCEVTQEELTIEPIVLESVVIDFNLNKDE